jgi:small neutral amino acid transporter SnatA (MarC family)
MRYGAHIVAKLGDTGVKLMVRIIGIILLGISLQMIIGTILTLI